MCGRYARARNLEMLREKLRIARMVLEELGIIPKQGYNVAPTQSVTTFKMQDGAIVETNMRWGMFATWSAAPITNARAETIESKAMFKEAFLRRRCVQPAVRRHLEPG